MAIPLTYNLRNLVVRRTTTLMTALGIALTVAVLLAVFALVNGLKVTLATSGDPRHVLKRNLKKASGLGYTYYVGPELEYFYFRRATGAPEILDEMGYYDQVPPDIGSDLRRETALALGARPLRRAFSCVNTSARGSRSAAMTRCSSGFRLSTRKTPPISEVLGSRCSI